MKIMLALPIPPLELGTSWTGIGLVKYIMEYYRERGNEEARMALVNLYETEGPERFKAFFTQQAKKLNDRFAARVLDERRIRPTHEVN